MAAHNPNAGGRDMLLSLAVLLVPIVLIVWFFQQTPDEPPLPTVNWQATVESARSQGDFPVLAPAELPATWRATSSYWERRGAQLGERTLQGDEYSLGVLDNDQRHVSLKQANAPAGPWLKGLMRQGRQVGQVDVNHTAWTTWESADGKTHYLTRTVANSTVLLTADQTLEPLVAFAGMLREG